MATPFKKVQSPATALYSGLSAAGTSMIITPYPKDLDGNKLTMAALGSTPQVTVDPKVSSYEEIIGFTGITDNGDGTATLTGLSRDMASSNLATPGTGKQHGAGAVVIISWNPQDVSRLAALENDNAFTGLNTFSQSPTVPSPTNPTDIANKSYADNLVIAGGADASVTVKGVSRLATSPNVTKGVVTVTIASPAVFSFSTHGLTAGDTIQLTTSGSLPTGLAASTTYYVIAAGLTANAFEVSATFGGSAINTSGSQSGTHTLIKTTPVAVGDNDIRVNPYWIDTGAANAYVITPVPAVAAYAIGQKFVFKVVNANTTASTLNVNGLGAKTIKKLSATDVVANDILAGAMVEVEYDGTNFQMINQIGNASLPNSYLDTDGTLAANSDSKVASQKAVKTYVTAQIATVTPVFVNGTTTQDISSSTTTNIAHGLGKVPKKVKITAIVSATFFSIGAYDGTHQSLVYTANGSSQNSDTYTIWCQSSTNTLRGVVTVDGTNIIITWTKNGSPTGTAYIMWEVE